MFHANLKLLRAFRVLTAHESEDRREDDEGEEEALS